MLKKFTDYLKPEARVLVLAPHPDDFDAIAVTLNECFQKNCPITVKVLTGSSSGVLDDFCGPDPIQKMLVREDEQRNSIRFFGLNDEDLSFLRLKEDDNGDLLLCQDAEDAIRQILDGCNPDLVFMPHGNDTNYSHQRVFSIFHKLAVDRQKPMTAFYIKDPKTTQIRVDCYTGFEQKAADWKGELLRFHKSQHERNLIQRGFGFDRRILDVNRNIAKELNFNSLYAEAFEVETFND